MTARQACLFGNAMDSNQGGRPGLLQLTIALEVKRQLQEMADAKGVEIRVDPKLPMLVGDPARIELVFLNLVSNAIKYSDPLKAASFVEMSCVQDGAADGKVVLCVRDNGIGISESDQESIFERFFRAHPHRDADLGVTGSGLGLAIVEDCVTAMGGSIRCESTLDTRQRKRIFCRASRARRGSIPRTVVGASELLWTVSWVKTAAGAHPRLRWAAALSGKSRRIPASSDTNGTGAQRGILWRAWQIVHVTATSTIESAARRGILFARRPMMRVRLTKKFAERVNGVDLARRRVGDVFELEDSEAERLIDVGWATAEIERRRGSAHPFSGVERRRRPLA